MTDVDLTSEFMMNADFDPDQLDLPERGQPPMLASSSRTPTPRWPAEPTRNGVVICGVCQRANHETRFWCARCGHAIDIPLSQCVCGNVYLAAHATSRRVFSPNKSTTSGENLVARGCESLWMKRFDALPNE